MDTLLKRLTIVVAYIDDFVVTGAADEEHLQNLREVLSGLKSAGLRLKRDKCQFWMSQVECIGHLIDKEGYVPQHQNSKQSWMLPLQVTFQS